MGFLFPLQLRAALFDIHDIFFTMPLEERFYLLQQDRDLRTERKLREMVLMWSTCIYFLMEILISLVCHLAIIVISLFHF